MKLFLTDCRHCSGTIRSDVDYCHRCGRLIASLPPVARGSASRTGRYKRRLIGIAVILLAIGLVILVEEPWYEPPAPRLDEIMMPMTALSGYGLDSSAVEDRIAPGETRVALVRLGTGHVYDDAALVPFSDFAFLVTFSFPIRSARHDNTEELHKVFDGYVDEKWTRFWVAVEMTRPDGAEADRNYCDYQSTSPLRYLLPVSIEVLDRNRLLVLPKGIPEKGRALLLVNSPPYFLSVYYNTITRKAYHYFSGYGVNVSPDVDEPEPTGRYR